MCQLVVKAVAAGDATVLADARRICRQQPPWEPTDHRALCNMILHTCYMGTVNSSQGTKDRAATLAGEIGAYHMPAVIDPMVAGVKEVFFNLTQVAARDRLLPAARGP